MLNNKAAADKQVEGPADPKTNKKDFATQMAEIEADDEKQLDQLREHLQEELS